MYVRPSTSVIVAPFALLMNRGVPPTPRNARTGELTPPGINSIAFANSVSDVDEAFCCLMCVRITVLFVGLCQDRRFVGLGLQRLLAPAPLEAASRPRSNQS